MELVLDETETDDPSLVGEVCHIVAVSEDGPRGISELSAENRDRYSNLILLCNVHHKMIDDQPNEFTVVKLRGIKDSHEQFVASSLDSIARQNLKNKELVAGYIDHWGEVCDIENWLAWTSSLLSPDPRISKKLFNELRELSLWILSRCWPPQAFDGIRDAFNNFRKVMSGFLNTFQKYREPSSDGEDSGEYWTKRFYRIEEWDEARYAKLLLKYEAHCNLVADYVAELTRAANYLLAIIRKEVLPDFRLREGLFLISSGPNMNLQWTTYRTEYTTLEASLLFLDEEDFNIKRLGRDVCFGSISEAELLDVEYKFRKQMIE